jgi:hypothetical protein
MFRRFVPFFAVLVLAGSAPAASTQSLTFGILEVQNRRGRGLVRDGYDRGYGEGVRQGEFDARRGLALNFERDPIFRDGLRGYDRRFGSRDLYRDEFRRGYINGYRSSYARLRPAPAPPFLQRNGPPPGVFGSQQQRPGGYQEPAYARGYSDGYRQGTDDGRGRDGYDPVGHRDYRDADGGYYGAYGSRDAYRNNYRAGFREGYEDGYRDGTGRRR